MASTTAALLLKPQAVATTAPVRNGGAVLFIPFRGVSGLYSSSNASDSGSLARGLKSWKPSALAPMVDDKGCITPAWNKFFDYLIETVLGGASGSTLPQVQRSIGYSEAQALIVNAISAALQQQVVSNAQTLQAVVEIAQATAIPGAAQIPAVQLQPVEVATAYALLPPSRTGSANNA